MNKIRTRYAPSPTGYLHIGGARTALFSYLFAKKHNGDFIIRIEDTDLNRNINDGEKSQIDNLKWLGIIPDESPSNENIKYKPYRQSERLKIYNKYIDILLKKEYAYIAYDSKEELLKQKEEQRRRKIFSFRYDLNWLKISQEEKKKRYDNNNYVIRIKLESNINYSWDDLIRSKISVNTLDIGDFVIRKQNGYPTYNFACVIDDYLMEISHVFRGEEHISNTPKQIAIYKIMKWETPQFAHFTIITNMDGKKLSKRDKNLEQFISDYKNKGYISEAIFNFLSLLGWSPHHTNEIMSKDQIIKDFDMNRMSKSPTKFDDKKLKWYSNQYYKKLDIIELRSRLIPYIEDQINNKEEEWVNLLLQTFQPQIYADYQIKNLSDPIFNIRKLDDNSIKLLKLENSKIILKTFYNLLIKSDFTLEKIKENINMTQKLTNERGKNFFMPLRAAITHINHGPELYKYVYLIGKNDTLRNIERWIK